MARAQLGSLRWFQRNLKTKHNCKYRHRRIYRRRRILRIGKVDRVPTRPAPDSATTITVAQLEAMADAALAVLERNGPQDNTHTPVLALLAVDGGSPGKPPMVRLRTFVKSAVSSERSHHCAQPALQPSATVRLGVVRVQGGQPRVCLSTLITHGGGEIGGSQQGTPAFAPGVVQGSIPDRIEQQSRQYASLIVQRMFRGQATKRRDAASGLVATSEPSHGWLRPTTHMIENAPEIAPPPSAALAPATAFELSSAAPSPAPSSLLLAPRAHPTSLDSVQQHELDAFPTLDRMQLLMALDRLALCAAPTLPLTAKATDKLARAPASTFPTGASPGGLRPPIPTMRAGGLGGGSKRLARTPGRRGAGAEVSRRVEARALDLSAAVGVPAAPAAPAAPVASPGKTTSRARSGGGAQTERVRGTKARGAAAGSAGAGGGMAPRRSKAAGRSAAAPGGVGGGGVNAEKSIAMLTVSLAAATAKATAKATAAKPPKAGSGAQPRARSANMPRALTERAYRRTPYPSPTVSPRERERWARDMPTGTSIDCDADASAEYDSAVEEAAAARSAADADEPRTPERLFEQWGRGQVGGEGGGGAPRPVNTKARRLNMREPEAMTRLSADAKTKALYLAFAPSAQGAHMSRSPKQLASISARL